MTRVRPRPGKTSSRTNATEGAGQTYYYVVSAVEDGADNLIGDGTNADSADDDLGEWSDYKPVTFVDFAPLAPIDGTDSPTAISSDSEDQRGLDLGQVDAAGRLFDTASKRRSHLLDAPVADLRDQRPGLNRCDRRYAFVPPHTA